MKKEEILLKIKNDIDYIPSLEEYKLIANEEFSIGESPLFTITLINSKDKSLIAEVESQTNKSRPDGLYELYCQLEVNGYCRTYGEERIYYVAYTLAQKKIDFMISGLDYKFKLKKKLLALNELEKQFNKM